MLESVGVADQRTHLRRGPIQKLELGFNSAIFPWV